MNCLSIDVGTTRCKCQLFSKEGEILEYLSRDYDFKRCGKDNYINVDVLWTNIRAMIQEVSQKPEISSMCISLLGESFVLLAEDDNFLFYPTLYTKPELVGDFLERTNVDALAIAFGAVHGLYKKEPNLDMDLITEITKVTDVPLVMYGGSDVSADDYREVIKRGVVKINYYSYMAYADYAKAKEIVNTVDADYYHNIGYSARQVMKEDTIRILKVFSNL